MVGRMQGRMSEAHGIIFGFSPVWRGYIYFFISCLTRNAFQVVSICVYLDYGACFVKSLHRLIWIVKLFPLLKLYGADKSTPFIFFFFFYDGWLPRSLCLERTGNDSSSLFFLEPDSGYQVVTEKHIQWYAFLWIPPCTSTILSTNATTEIPLVPLCGLNTLADSIYSQKSLFFVPSRASSKQQ